MKNRKIIAFVTLLLILSAGTLFAQTSKTHDRDIRIAEGILAEIFDAKDTAFTLRGATVRGVTGEYIPGYGVHFKIGANIHPQTLRVVIRGHAQIERDEEQDPPASEEENRAFIEERFMEYFKNYASLLRSIPGDEVVRLTFGDNRSARTVFSYPPRANRQRDSIPAMTAWASVSDINAYSEGNLTDEEFENRIQVKDLSQEETQRDQEVFASILETALNQAGTENLRVRRSPRSEYLPGLGLNYQVHVSLRSWPFMGDLDLEGLEVQLDSLAIGLSELGETLGEHLLPMAAKLDSIFNPDRRGRESPARVYRDTLRPQRENVQRSARMMRRNMDESQVPEEKILEEIDKLHAELKQTVMEYGQTLRSLQDDEMLIITLHWAGRHPALPEHSELRIRKSELLDGAEPEIQVTDRK
jgi:hypothetical protein